MFSPGGVDILRGWVGLGWVGSREVCEGYRCGIEGDEERKFYCVDRVGDAGAREIRKIKRGK